MANLPVAQDFKVWGSWIFSFLIGLFQGKQLGFDFLDNHSSSGGVDCYRGNGDSGIDKGFFIIFASLFPSSIVRFAADVFFLVKVIFDLGHILGGFVGFGLR
jgi:hypothetical protein